jgi:hypothetical protein
VDLACAIVLVAMPVGLALILAAGFMVRAEAAQDEVIHDATDVARYVVNHKSADLKKATQYEGCTYSVNDQYQTIGDFAYESFRVTAECKDRWKDLTGVMREGNVRHNYVVTLTPTSFSVDQMQEPELEP